MTTLQSKKAATEAAANAAKENKGSPSIKSALKKAPTTKTKFPENFLEPVVNGIAVKKKDGETDREFSNRLDAEALARRADTKQPYHCL